MLYVQLAWGKLRSEVRFFDPTFELGLFMAVQSPITQTNLRMSYEEFLAWSDENTHAEWVNGEVIQFMPAKPVHQILVGFLYNLIKIYADLFRLGQAHVAPLEMRLKNSSREPDLLFLTTANSARLTPDRVEGGADLAVEIISTESVRRDRQDKFMEYRDAGIREYWIIDPREGKQRADFYRLDDGGDYVLIATEEDEKVTSEVIEGFWIRPNWLWQANTLMPMVCALEIEGVAAALQAQIDAVQAAKKQEEDSE